MTYAVADHRAVLLLNPGRVVLAVRPGTGELDAPLGAVLDQRLVDGHAVVVHSALVRVDAFDGKGSCRPMASSPATTRDCSRASSGTAAVQPVQISVATRLWIMEPHQEPPWWTTRSISRWPGGGAFQSAKVRSAKVRTGILRASGLLPPSSEPGGRRCPDGLEQSVQGGGAGRQQSLAHLRVQIQVAIALHGLHQVRQRRLQPLAADPVCSFPNHDQRLTNCSVVDASAPFYRGLLLPIVAGLPPAT